MKNRPNKTLGHKDHEPSFFDDSGENKCHL